MKSDCIVIGGGVIGLLTAYEFAKSGLDVTLIEKTQLGKESSWAGGGILGALKPWTYPDAIHVLARWSEQHYPILVAELKQKTGKDPEFFQSGMLYLDAPTALLMAWAKQYQKKIDVLSWQQLQNYLPIASETIETAVLLQETHQIRNPLFLQAIKMALLANKKIRILENTTLESFRLEGDKIIGINTTQGNLSAGAVVMCTGAWTGNLLSQLGLDNCIAPIKGEMLLLKGLPEFIQPIVNYHGYYLIPRKDGYFLAGSTVEKSGFNTEVTAEARTTILGNLYRAMPGLSAFECVKQWSGLRPGSLSGVPLIGAIPHLKGLFANAGHYRNGLLLAPASARLLVDLVLNRTPVVDPTPYSYRVLLAKQ